MLQKLKLKICKTRLKIEPTCSIPITKVFPFRQFSSDCFITRVSTHSLCWLARVGKRRKERNRKNFFLTGVRIGGNWSCPSSTVFCRLAAATSLFTFLTRFVYDVGPFWRSIGVRRRARRVLCWLHLGRDYWNCPIVTPIKSTTALTKHQRRFRRLRRLQQVCIK